MSSKASTRKLRPGERFEFTNTSGKAVDLILKTEWGTAVRTTLPIGGHIDFSLGQERGSLYIREHELNEAMLRVVPTDRTG